MNMRGFSLLALIALAGCGAPDQHDADLHRLAFESACEDQIKAGLAQPATYLASGWQPGAIEQNGVWGWHWEFTAQNAFGMTATLRAKCFGAPDAAVAAIEQ
jgi:hypothetical protein